MATVKKSQVDALMLGLSDEERQNALNKMQNSQNAVVADYAKNYNLQNSTASKALGEQTKVDLSNLVKGGASGKEYEYDAASWMYKEKWITNGTTATKGSTDLSSLVATTNNEKINGVNKEYMAGMKAIDQAQGGLLLSKDILKNTQSWNVGDVAQMQSDIEEAYGMGLTDSQAIADKYGRQVQAIDLIKNGKVNELIQLNPEYEERANKQNYRNVEDIETATARLKQDFERNNQRASELTTKTIDRLLADNTNASIKAIASAQATGSLGSGGFAYALSQVQKGYQRAIDDAWTNYEQYNDDQKLALNRGLEDYTTELERINYSMEEVRKNLQLQTLSTFQDIMTQQGLNTQKASQLLLEYQGKVEQIMYEANAEATKNLIDAHYDFSSRRVARLLCFTRTPIGEYPQLFAGLTSRMSLPRLVLSLARGGVILHHITGFGQSRYSPNRVNFTG